jgi:hypothetical protein
VVVAAPGADLKVLQELLLVKLGPAGLALGPELGHILAPALGLLASEKPF